MEQAANSRPKHHSHQLLNPPAREDVLDSVERLKVLEAYFCDLAYAHVRALGISKIVIRARGMII